MIVLSSSTALGFILGIAILIIGKSSMSFTIDVELGPIDALWAVLGLPALSVLLFVVLSPVSFLIYKAFGNRWRKEGTPGA